MTKMRVNIRATVNREGIRRETEGGREYLVAPSVTLPDGIVMNGIEYPADEIEASYQTLENTHAPLGHPEHDGALILAIDPRAQPYLIGGFNRNVKRVKEGNAHRVHVEKWIDIEVANRSEGGKRVLEALEGGKQVHTSTGLLLKLDTANGKRIARNMMFDHDAILLDEEGAVTPEDGVGIHVNRALDSEGKEIEVVNSALDEAEQHLDWAIEEVARAADRLERAPAIERFKTAIMEALFGGPAREETNQEAQEIALDKEQFEKLSATVNGVKEAQDGIADVIANAVKEAVAPLQEQVATLTANAKAADEAEREQLLCSLVDAGLYEQGDLEGVSMSTLQKMANNAAPKSAAGVFSAFTGGDETKMEPID